MDIRLLRYVSCLIFSISSASHQGMAATRAALTEASMEVTADKLQNAANELQKTAPSFMLLDFQRVSGFDASSAQVCQFHMLPSAVLPDLCVQR